MYNNWDSPFNNWSNPTPWNQPPNHQPGPLGWAAEVEKLINGLGYAQQNRPPQTPPYRQEAPRHTPHLELGGIRYFYYVVRLMAATTNPMMPPTSFVLMPVLGPFETFEEAKAASSKILDCQPETTLVVPLPGYVFEREPRW